MKIQNTFHRHRRNRSLGTLAVIASLSILAAASAQAALTVHYTFDNADIIGTAAQNDQTANNNDSGEPTGGGFTTGVAGQFGEAYNLSKNGYVPIASGVVPSGTSARTISLWFNQDAEVAGKMNILFGYGSTAPGTQLEPGFENGSIRIRHYAGYVDYGSGFDFDGTDAGWHHLALRVNSGASTFADLDVFLDGTLLSVAGTANQGTSQSLNTLASEFRIGGSPTRGGGDSFDGSVDELNIFDEALTNDNIVTLAAGGVVPEPSAALLGGLGALLLLRRRRN